MRLRADLQHERNGGDGTAGNRDAGFALIVVIWIAGVLALLTLSFASSARVHVRMAANTIANAAAESLADAGVNLGLLQLVDSHQQPGRSFAGERVCRLPDDDRLFLAVTDEAGRVDLNHASAGLITALLVGADVSRDDAQRLAEAIIAVRAGTGSVRDPRTRSGSFEVLDEVRGVPALHRDIFAAIQPHITVRSGLDGIDPRQASPELLRRLSGAAPARDAAPILPPAFTAASTSHAFLIRAVVLTKAKALAVREVVATVVPVRSPVAAPVTDLGFGSRARARPEGAAAPRFEAKTWEWRAGIASALERRALEVGDPAAPPC